MGERTLNDPNFGIEITNLGQNPKVDNRNFRYNVILDYNVIF